MGLLEYLAGLADTGKRNVKAGLLDPELFATRVAENARDWGRGLLNSDRKSVVPEVRAAGQREQMDAASQLFGGGAIKVWHGSPHKFDKFDFSKIGTGEGAQAYGHGGYFAEAKDVAKEYAKMDPSSLPPPNRAFNGVELEPGSPEYHAGTLLEGMGLQQARKRVASWIAESAGDPRMAKEVAGWQKTLDTLNTAKSKSDFKVLPNNHLYEANLRWPDAAREAADPLGPQHFLDWDKGLNEQSPQVRGLLSKAGYTSYVDEMRNTYLSQLPAKERALAEKMIDGPDTARTGDAASRSWKALYKAAPDVDHNVIHDIADYGSSKGGSDIVAELGRFGTDPAGASKRLSDMGIPGIRYLDGGSRNAGQGTSNYVAFDDALAEILSRNGQPLGLLGR